jgi:hypothetical protein
MTDHLIDLRRLVETISRQERQRDRLIRQAFDPERRRALGYTIDDIGEAADLSRQRIYQIAGDSEAGQA